MQDVTIGFGGPPVLDRVTLRIDAGERIGLVGRNGSGKSTLMRLVHGELACEQGEIIRQQRLSVAMLTQEVPEDLAGRVFDVVAQGLGAEAELLAAYHRISLEYAASHSPSLHAELTRLEGAIDAQGAWRT